MTASVQIAEPLDLQAIRGQVDAALADFLRDKARAGAKLRLPEEITRALHTFLFAGGKRIRPLLCVLGWYAAAGSAAPPQAVIKAAASLELFHASVLIHDDIIDNSETRRDRPTVHRALAGLYDDRPDPIRFGADAAIVLGDLAMVWSAELLDIAQLTAAQLGAARTVVDAMRSDVMYGQYLDLLASGRPSGDIDRAMQIVRYKTVAYTFDSPLHLGAAIADAGARIHDALTCYARPLGEAFQLQDDLLGVYGDPARTGKSNLEDLRDGKHTVLVAIALEHADAEQAARLRSLLGDPELDDCGAASCRDIIAATARETVHQMIRARWAEANRVLDKAPFPASVIEAMRHIADDAIERTK
ncbi:polyprenyl synthetase family protein [Nocardia sp. GCM10030253]|uniref:polyprenyl synthetase family protein n=1 Tax=Nocardia sp. GCM10030253 TaxID=3273404 RepID=UPI003631E967